MTKKKNDFDIIYDEHDPDNPDKVRKAKPAAPQLSRAGWIFLGIAVVFLGIGVTGIISKTVLSSSSALPTLMPTDSPVVAPTRTNVLTNPGVISTLPPTWTPTVAAPTE